ncbi:Rabenosyn-5 [Aphelenchoides fujianensis]|nr:Rabenosyn-5 [Aphelenchoides fujianensis]
MSDEIRQGFLCPFCMKDQEDVERLQRHVAAFHSETNSDPLDLIKGVFSSAKRRLNELDFARGFPTEIPHLPLQQQEVTIVEKPQVLGVTRSHREDFFREQRAHNDEVETLTNTLIIRLDRLINDPTMEGDRKEFEKRTVPWAEDSNSPNCRHCAAKFSLTKRKHHCRLCGKIVCSQCSRFLDFVSARKLTNPAFAADVLNGVETKSPPPGRLDVRRSSSTFLAAGVNSLQMMRSKTERLLTAIINENENGEKVEENMRICFKCKEYLGRREKKMDLMGAPSVFVDLYDRLCQLITQITNLAPSFRRMALSLQNGESLYTLNSAIQLRKKLVCVQREITDLSERIEQWGLTNDPAAPRRPTPRELIVQKNIRYLAINSLQDVVTNLPDIPTEEEYNRLREQHKRRVHAEQERERQLQSRRSTQSLHRAGRTESETGSGANSPPVARNVLKTSASFSGLRNEDSWTPEPTAHLQSTNPFFESNEPEHEMHPIAQQYLIIKSYLKQAAEAGRQEEVVMLEQNLQLIEEELQKLEIGTPRAP